MDLTKDWTVEQLQYKPDENSWNALQVMEHVFGSEYGTLAYMKKKTQAAAQDIPVATDENTNASGQLNKALISDQKWQAPAVLPQPTGKRSREEMIAMYDRLGSELEKFISELPEDYHHRQIFKHALVGRMNLTHTLEFLANHYAHHVHQIRRLSENF